MNMSKELAYRYDLFITPVWRDRFDTIVDQKIEMPLEGRILDVNCGTGAYAVELAGRIRGKGEVIAVDSNQERVELARAKALVANLDNISFDVADPSRLSFRADQFDLSIGDASLLAPAETEPVLQEVVRVARPGSRVILKTATHGSFDEFFSIYWEALLDCGLADEVWGGLEALIKERKTVSDSEETALRAGLRDLESFTSREEFFFESGERFLESPMIADAFLDYWLAVIPRARRAEVSRRISSVIDRERHGGPFDVSIKATVLTGVK